MRLLILALPVSPYCRHLAAIIHPRFCALSAVPAAVWRRPATARPAIRSTAVAGLRERDHLANRRLAGQQRHDPIEPERDAAVRRRAVFERLEEEAEAQLRLLVADAEPPEDPRLQLARREFGCCRRRSRCRSAPGRRPWRAPLPGSLSSLSMSASAGEVNGWCIENQRCSSPFHSSSGKSVTQRNANCVRVQQVLLLRDRQPQLPEQLGRRLGRPAAISSRSSAVAPLRSSARAQRRLGERLHRAGRRLARAAPRSSRRSPSASPDRPARRSGCACTCCRRARRSRG